MTDLQQAYEALRKQRDFLLENEWTPQAPGPGQGCLVAQHRGQGYTMLSAIAMLFVRKAAKTELLRVNPASLFMLNAAFTSAAQPIELLNEAMQLCKEAMREEQG